MIEALTVNPRTRNDDKKENRTSSIWPLKPKEPNTQNFNHLRHDGVLVRRVRSVRHETETFFAETVSTLE